MPISDVHETDANTGILSDVHETDANTGICC
jgi:hypothetical protein